jgi:hypothetical protein
MKNFFILNSSIINKNFFLFSKKKKIMTFLSFLFIDYFFFIISLKLNTFKHVHTKMNSFQQNQKGHSNFGQSSFYLTNFKKLEKNSFLCKSLPSDKSSEFSSNRQNFFQSQTPNKKSSQTQKSRFRSRSEDNANYASKQQVVSITYEEIGLFPRSFNRVFDRFFKQLFFDVENLVIQEYRFYRYLFLTTVKCLFILLFVPLGINFLSKNYFIRPITEYYWNTHTHEIFLNSYQQKRAFSELKNFEEKIYFESFLLNENQIFSPPVVQKSETNLGNSSLFIGGNNNIEETGFINPSSSQVEKKSRLFSKSQKKETKQTKDQTFEVEKSMRFPTTLQKRLQVKIFELANHYNEESIEAVTNFFADILSFITLCFLLVRLEIQINITKSFLLEVFFGLDDSKKSLLILFVTDLLVGYHSPNIWELFFQTLFDHYGLPESQTTIFLLVATLPVLLDVLFKYLIFRHLNRASPATVATYHAMIE